MRKKKRARELRRRNIRAVMDRRGNAALRLKQRAARRVRLHRDRRVCAVPLGAQQRAAARAVDAAPPPMMQSQPSLRGSPLPAAARRCGDAAPSPPRVSSRLAARWGERRRRRRVAQAADG